MDKANVIKALGVVTVIMIFVSYSLFRPAPGGEIQSNAGIVMQAQETEKLTQTKSVTEPTNEPTPTPTNEPTATPTNEPTATPTNEPTATPTNEPTATPTNEPTATPTNEPTTTPTNAPTNAPTATPVPTNEPTDELEPTPSPTYSILTDPTIPKYVAITFDDGPGTCTEELLDTLKEYGAHATFFVLGQRVEYYSEVVDRAYKEGHEIGNHTYNHKQLTILKQANLDYQLDETNNVIESAIGVKPILMRPSYGARNENVIKSIAERDMSVILWNVDPRDWDTKDAEVVSQHIIERAKDGDIILLHDIYSTTVEAAKISIKELTARGFVFLTVSELIERENKEVMVGGVYMSGKGVEDE